MATNVDLPTDQKNFSETQILIKTLKQRNVKHFFKNVNANTDKDAILNMMIEKYNRSYQEVNKE